MSEYLLTTLLAIATTSVTAFYITRRQNTPATRLLCGVCLILCLVAVSQAVLLTPSPIRTFLAAATGISLPGEYWLVSAFGLTFFAAGLWLLFAVTYTGRGRRLRRSVAALLVAFVGFCYLTVAHAVLTAGHDRPVDAVATDIFASGLFFLSPLASLGTLLIVEVALRQNAIPLGEGATLAAGGSLFIYAPIVAFNTNSRGAITALLAVSGVLLGVAVRWYPVFETLPAARIAARDRLINAMDDPIVLVDRQYHVVDFNPQAASTFDIATPQPSRCRLRDIAPDTVDPTTLVESEEPDRVQINNRYFDVTANPITTESGTPVGCIIVCRDVTERERRDHRLRVLTQFLAGTIGERASAIAVRGRQINTNAAASDGQETASVSAVAQDIRETTESLQRLMSATREVEQALSNRENEQAPVIAIARELAAGRSDVTAEDADGIPDCVLAAVDPAVLRAVLSLLIEDYTQRSSDDVCLSVRSTTDTTVEIVLSSAPQPTNRQGGLSGDVPRRQPNQARKADPVAGEDDPLITLSRLALEEAGGSVEATDAGPLRVSLPLDTTNPTDYGHTSAAAERRGPTLNSAGERS